MPEVRFGSPKGLSTEPFLTWWHIPVMVKVKRGWRGLVVSADLEHGRLILIFEGPDRRNALPLLWQSLEGPCYHFCYQNEPKQYVMSRNKKSENPCFSAIFSFWFLLSMAMGTIRNQ